MAKKALINKQQGQPKFRVRAYTRCRRCGRPRAVYKKLLALPDLFPGVGACRRASGGDQSVVVMNTDLVKSTKSRKRKFSSNISDPVADLLTRIRNANLAYKDELIAPISKLAESILKILEQEGYIDGFDREGEGVEQAFRIR